MGLSNKGLRLNKKVPPFLFVMSLFKIFISFGEKNKCIFKSCYSYQAFRDYLDTCRCLCKN